MWDGGVGESKGSRRSRSVLQTDQGALARSAPDTNYLYKCANYKDIAYFSEEAGKFLSTTIICTIYFALFYYNLCEILVEILDNNQNRNNHNNILYECIVLYAVKALSDRE